MTLFHRIGEGERFRNGVNRRVVGNSTIWALFLDRGWWGFKVAVRIHRSLIAEAQDLPPYLTWLFPPMVRAVRCHLALRQLEYGFVEDQIVLRLVPVLQWDREWGVP